MSLVLSASAASRRNTDPTVPPAPTIATMSAPKSPNRIVTGRSSVTSPTVAFVRKFLCAERVRDLSKLPTTVVAAKRGCTVGEASLRLGILRETPTDSGVCAIRVYLSLL